MRTRKTHTNTHGVTHLLNGADGVVDQRPLVVIDFKRHADRGQRRQDVAEKDDAVRAEAAEGLLGWGMGWEDCSHY